MKAVLISQGFLITGPTQQRFALYREQIEHEIRAILAEENALISEGDGYYDADDVYVTELFMKAWEGPVQVPAPDWETEFKKS